MANSHASHNAEITGYVANLIGDAICDDDFEVHHLTIDHENVGPLGGVSSKVTFWCADNEGELHAVIVNVYSDDRTKTQLTNALKAEARKVQEQERLRRMVIDGDFTEDETTRAHLRDDPEYS